MKQGAFQDELDPKIQRTTNLINSSNDSDKIEGLRIVLGMMSKGKDVSFFFPHIIQNIYSKNLKIKRYVYIYLVENAHKNTDLACLSINAFEKDLKHRNHLFSAFALKVLSSLKVDEVSEIILEKAQEAAVNVSQYVRRSCAFSLPKILLLDEDLRPQLVELVGELLNDESPLVLGGALFAFNTICPDYFEFIDSNFYKICALIPEMDEWSQVVALEVLLRYSRTQFVDCRDTGYIERDFFDSGDEQSDNDAESRVNDDLLHMLKSLGPLLHSQNSSVVMATCSLFFYVAPAPTLGKNLVAPMIKILNKSFTFGKKVVILKQIRSFCTRYAHLFSSHYKNFLVHPSDPNLVKSLKLEILTTIATSENATEIIRILKDNIETYSGQFVLDAVEGMGKCAFKFPETIELVLSNLMQFIESPNPGLASQSIVVIKKLLANSKDGDRGDSSLEIIIQLARKVDGVTDPQARASIMWLVGEFSRPDAKQNIAPDFLRIMVKKFKDEENIVKLQILNMGVKTYLRNPEKTELLFRYLLKLAKYDVNYDIRSKAYFYSNLLFSGLDIDFKKVFLSDKPVAQWETHTEDTEEFRVGSLSHIFQLNLKGYLPIPDFPETEPVNEIRRNSRWTRKSSVRREVSARSRAGYGHADLPRGVGSVQRVAPPKRRTVGFEDFLRDEDEKGDSDSWSSSEKAHEDEESSFYDESGEERPSGDEYESSFDEDSENEGFEEMGTDGEQESEESEESDEGFVFDIEEDEPEKSEEKDESEALSDFLGDDESSFEEVLIEEEAAGDGEVEGGEEEAKEEGGEEVGKEEEEEAAEEVAKEEEGEAKEVAKEKEEEAKEVAEEEEARVEADEADGDGDQEEA